MFNIDILRHGGGKTSKKYTMMNFVHDPPFLIHISILLIISFRMIIIFEGGEIAPPPPLNFENPLSIFYHIIANFT